MKKYLLLGVLAIFLNDSVYSQKTQKRPNILFITVDDMNSWAVLENYKPLQVPNLRKLISESYTFPNATTAAPVCIPSRAAFFSGVYSYRSGLYKNVQDGWQRSSVLKEIETIPEFFKRNGYETWGRGKTFHVDLPEGREARMFDNEVWHGGFGPYADKAHQATSNKAWFGIQPWTGPDSDFPDVVNTDAAIEFLSKKHDKPFLMYLGIYRPHNPYTAPKRFYDLYNEKEMGLPPGFLKNDLEDIPQQGRELSEGLQKVMVDGLSEEDALYKYLKAYCAGYSFADWNIGRVMEALDKSEFAKNTIVVFCSDNGFHTGTKDHWTKTTLWEQADGIPFLVRLPNGKSYKMPQTVSTIDIFPTLIDYAGLGQPRQKLDGQSMLPILKDPKRKWDRPGITVADENYTSVRSERYRYIQYPDGSAEFYDHQTDPYEHTNLIGREDLKTLIGQHKKSVPGSFAKAIRPLPGGKNGNNDGE